MKIGLTTVFALSIATAGAAETLRLSPANPQPSAGSLNAGLSVSYVNNADGRTLQAARSKLRRAKLGTPLRGLSYPDGKGKALTSNSSTQIAAAISGYVRFDKAGTFNIEFLSNDGVQASIGGKQVVLFDGVHGCVSGGLQKVQVPVAGWYKLKATYFQRKGGSCLSMKTDASGKMRTVPDRLFSHTN